jgi:NarL family two-component system response regulator LiaR
MSGNTNYSIMIVDDHDMVRAGLKTYLMLEPKFEVVAEASNGRDALAQMESMKRRPDLVLMDLMMPIMDGVQTTEAMMQRYPELKIVMLTSFLEDDKVLAAVEAGAVSYVLKTVSAEELIYALIGAAKGMPVIRSRR